MGIIYIHANTKIQENSVKLLQGSMFWNTNYKWSPKKASIKHVFYIYKDYIF